MSETEVRGSGGRERSGAATTVLVATGDGLHDATRGDVVFPGRRVDAIAADGGTVWVVVDGAQLHAVVDGRSDHVATVAGGRAGSVVAHRGDVYVGGDEARLWVLRHGALERVTSFDRAPTSDGWYTPWGGPPSVLSFASHSNDLYVSVHVGGILRTADRAATWMPTIDLHDDVHQVVADAATGSVWAATGASGLAHSRDRGATWTYFVDGLDGTYLLTAAVSDAGVLVGASSGHAASDGAVMLFDGTAFRRAAGLPADLGGAVGPRRLAAHGATAAVVLPDGSLFQSRDGGRSWEDSGARFADATEVALVRDP